MASRHDISVIVVRHGRRFLYARYTDPRTGKRVLRSTGTHNRREAERFAARWETELRAGEFRPASSLDWEGFRLRYWAEVLPGLSDATASKASATFNSLERILSPGKPSDLTADRLAKWQTQLRAEGLAESTIKSHRAHLLAALNWAADAGIIPSPPKIRTPARAKAIGKSTPMKGRPVSAAEFEAMVEAAPSVVGDARAPSWQYLLRGLYLSGLRLGEALGLSWDYGAGLSIDLSGEFPALAIRAEAEKGQRDRILPLAPEAAELILKTPEADRAGYVFAPEAARKHGPRLRLDRVSKVITSIGKSAGVYVTDRKPASAHDLRRSFGLRWSARVMPAVLQQLMRHESIDTTLRYYVGRDADTVARILYQARADDEADAT